jgi:hypothetical protein
VGLFYRAFEKDADEWGRHGDAYAVATQQASPADRPHTGEEDRAVTDN